MARSDAFRAMFDALPEIAWHARADGQRDYFNDRWYVYTGLSRRTAAVAEDGWDWLHQVHPEDLARVRSSWQDALEAAAPRPVELRLRDREGRFRWFLDEASPMLDANGRVTGWCGTCVDIDGHRRAQRLADSLVAQVSHALRTPLNAILGWTLVLQKRPEDLATVRQVADIVERNARAQARMVDDLLDASRIGAGTLALTLAPLDLREVVEDGVTDIRPAAQARGIALVANTGALPARVKGDAQRLGRVVAHLLSNAVRYTPDGGRVEVRLRTDARQAVLDIADTGRGIAPDELPYVFDRFRLDDDAPAVQAGGLGLGLSIVHGLVGLHGGSVQAVSDGPQRGATFTVSLPLAEVAEVAEVADEVAHDAAPHGAASAGTRPAPAAPLAADALADLRVLVVDDEADSRTLVARVLRDAGARVTQADGADEVSMALGKGLQFDLIVSDLGMPRVDGYSLVRMLHELPGAMAEVPTIALSGLNLPQDRTRAVQAGFQAFIAKPFSPAELVATAARLTGRG